MLSFSTHKLAEILQKVKDDAPIAHVNVTYLGNAQYRSFFLRANVVDLLCTPTVQDAVKRRCRIFNMHVAS